MFSNLLIYFVVIPLLMLAGFAICKNIRQVRTVAVAGSILLMGLSVWVLCDYIASAPQAIWRRCSSGETGHGSPR